MKFFRNIAKVLAALVAAVLFLVVATNAWTILSTRDDTCVVADLKDADYDAIVVLGASVYSSGKPSDILADRLEVAASLYKAGAGEVVIVSGDNRDSHYNESDAMKNYCVKLGIPDDRIYVDHAGYDTYSSIWRAQNVYGAQSVVAVTQAYHLYRAVATAQGLGMQAKGVPADKGAYDNQIRYSAREVVARTKDCVLTFFKVPPDNADESITL